MLSLTVASPDASDQVKSWPDLEGDEVRLHGAHRQSPSPQLHVPAVWAGPWHGGGVTPAGSLDVVGTLSHLQSRQSRALTSQQLL